MTIINASVNLLKKHTYFCIDSIKINVGKTECGIKNFAPVNLRNLWIWSTMD